MINLNKELTLKIENFKMGKTQNIVLKMGRKKHYLDITRDAISAFVEIYDYVCKDRETFSKYDANIKCIGVKNDAHLDRDFLEHIDEINKALAVVKKYKNELN